MRNRKTNLIIVLLTAMICVSAACRSNLQSSLAGKWKSTKPDSGDSWRFSADNKFEKFSAALGLTLTGAYKIEDGQTVTLQFDASDASAKAPAPIKVKVAAAGDTMTLDDGQRVYNYVRDSSPDTGSRAAASPELKPSEAIAVSSAKSEQIDAEIKFEVEGLQTGKPKLVGTTNLPEGTNLMMVIDGDSAEYAGRGKTAVSNGKFQSIEFSDEGKRLAKGSYFAEIIMPIAEAQPESVQQIIGRDGENLKGALVQKSSVGTTVKLKKEFTIK